LAYIPAAYKTSKDYSVIPADGSGDFAFTRDSGNAVSQRPDGLWQVGWTANTPRNVYTNGVLGRLVEPQRQMLISYPRSFARAEWTKINGRIEGDASTATGNVLQDTFAASGGSSISDVTETGFTDNFTAGGLTGNVFSRIGNESNYLTVGKLYYYEFDIVLNSGSYTGITVASGATILQSITNNGRYRGFLIPSLPTLYIRNANSGANKNYTVSNFSCKEASGFACPFVNNLGVNTNEGFKFTATAANAILNLIIAHTSITNSNYTNSVFLKRITGTGQVSILDVNNVARAITITSEWKRYEYAAAASGTSGQIGIQLATSGDEVMICHAQVELGTTSTSPIYGTEGGLVTRNADNIVKAGASALIGQTEGTVFVELDFSAPVSDNSNIFLLYNTGFSDYIWLYRRANGSLRIASNKNNSVGTILTTEIISVVKHKIAVRYKSGDWAISIDGASVITSSNTVNFPNELVNILVAGNISFGIASNIYYNVILLKSALSNAQLQQLTTL